MKKPFIPKELSWLSFNARVLQEAGNPQVPLMDRVRFLGIYSANLDQFFAIRVASLKRLCLVDPQLVRFPGGSPRRILKSIESLVRDQRREFELVYSGLLRDLERENIRIINENELSNSQTDFVHSYFKDHVQSKIFPVRTKKKSEFPVFSDRAVYLAVSMIRTRDTITHYSIIEIPTEPLPRFIELPRDNGEHVLIMLDDVIRKNLVQIFQGFEYDHFAAYEFKFNRDAELDIEDDIGESYLEKIDKSLRKRKHGAPVRFTYDAAMPDNMRDFFLQKLSIGDGDAVIAGGRYHNTSDFTRFPDLASRTIKNPPAVAHPLFPLRTNYFTVLAQRDALIHFPYHSFDHVLDFLRQAAIDSRVTAIKMTVYRLAKNSSIINALVNARKNNKKVTVVLELQARFDEEANISWATLLEQEGIRVIFGVEGLKVHTKLCLISREEGEGPRRKVRHYCIIGTGNFNEDTARTYIDTYLMTSDKRICNEIRLIFEYFGRNYKLRRFSHLLFSPFSMRRELSRLVRNEIKNARGGKTARIDLKINNLSDYPMIKLLYAASEAGVKIRIICRSMFSLVPGVPCVSENIEAISIVGSHLEHNRFIIFHNDGNPRCYLSSADWLPRNFDRRIEVACPVFDPALAAEIIDMFDISWRDNVKARILAGDLRNEFRKPQNGSRHDSQADLREYLLEKSQRLCQMVMGD